MQSTKARASPKESPQKVSPRPARKLKISPVEHSSPSSSNPSAAKTPKDKSPKVIEHSSPSSSNPIAAKTPKDKSPKVIERRSPRSPLFEKKRPSKLSELESQVTRLHDDLKKVKDQLVISESSKRDAQEDADLAKKQLEDASLKLEEYQKQISELVASKETTFVELQKTTQKKTQEWESQIECAHKQQSLESDALKSAYDEIEKLKYQLEAVPESQRESTHDELESLKTNLAETRSLVESMKTELQGSRESEAQAQGLVRETLYQLEAAKETVNTLRSDVIRSSEAYNSISFELEKSRARVSMLEGMVSKLNGDMETDYDSLVVINDDQRLGGGDVNQLELELQAMKSDVADLKSALEAADKRHNKERSQNEEEIRNASKLLEQIRVDSSFREAELKGELKKAIANIEELKANLMDKETELQGISEENESLNMKIEKSMSCKREKELENEMKKLTENVADLKAHLMDKETELQNILEENEILKQEIKKQETEKGMKNDQVEVCRAAEQEAMTKVGYMMEEAEKSKRKAARFAEQLEAAQSANSDMEAELRKLKVQSDQWRKAAEAAAAMLSPGKYVERTGSMPVDNNYSPIGGRLDSPYLDDYDDDSLKKKNGNVLKKFGVLWKKPQK